MIGLGRESFHYYNFFSVIAFQSLCSGLVTWTRTQVEVALKRLAEPRIFLAMQTDSRVDKLFHRQLFTFGRKRYVETSVSTRKAANKLSLDTGHFNKLHVLRQRPFLFAPLLLGRLLLPVKVELNRFWQEFFLTC